MSVPGMLRHRFGAWPLFQGAVHENETMDAIAALASTIGVTGAAFAVDGHTKVTGAATSPPGQTPQTAGVSGNNKTEDESFDGWMNKYATAHNGRITREEFMDQMSRRWDTLDAQRNGYMAPDQARRIYTPREERQ